MEDVDRLLNRSNNFLKNDISSIVVFASPGSLPKVLRVVIPAAILLLMTWVARFASMTLNSEMFIRFLVNIGAYLFECDFSNLKKSGHVIPADAIFTHSESNSLKVTFLIFLLDEVDCRLNVFNQDTSQ